MLYKLKEQKEIADAVDQKAISNLRERFAQDISKKIWIYDTPKDRGTGKKTAFKKTEDKNGLLAKNPATPTPPPKNILETKRATFRLMACNRHFFYFSNQIPRSMSELGYF